MADTDNTIRYINPGDGLEHPIDALYLGNMEAEEYQVRSNIVTDLGADPGDDGNNKYPSAKCVYDILGNLDSLIAEYKTIYYTTSDGSTITPAEGSITGSVINIVSNTYENGVGKIVYDGAVHGIGDGAFEGCTKLTGMTLPGRVKSFGNDVFKGCSKLKLTVNSDVHQLLKSSMDSNYGIFDIYDSDDAYQETLKHGRCLTFHADAAQTLAISNVGGNTTPNMEYSYDMETWNTLSTTAVSFGGDTGDLYVRGDNPDGISKSTKIYSKFVLSTSASTKCSGNIMHLLSYTEDLDTIPNDCCYYGMFYGCSLLTSAPELPATTLTNYCYYGMFYGCSSLTSAPELPATTLTEHCYQNMFNGCSSLTSVPELPATTLTNYCYYGMFYGCSSLTSVQELPATTLANYCYSGMFYNCSSLTSAPELPAMTLANYCYDKMFRSCTSLTSAPELPAMTLANYCYRNMFYGCSSLTSAPELPATTLTIYCYFGMFYNCSSLISAPELPAMTLVDYCYVYMFYGCTSLTSAPELPATTLANYCYYSMFYLCSSLTSAPELPAMTLADCCYEYMFEKCTSLKKIPNFNTLPQYDNSLTGMFANTYGIDYTLLNYTGAYLGQEMFINDTGIQSMHLGKDLQYIGQQVSNPTYNDVFPENLDYLTIDSENPYFMMKNDGLYSKDKTKFYGGPELGISMRYTTYDISEGVTEIVAGTLRSLGNGGDIDQETIDNEFETYKYTRPHFNISDCILTTVTVPSSCTLIGDRFLQYSSCLTSVVINAVTPPTLSTVNCFGGTYPIYVPAESVDAYKAATNWSTFVDRITAIA